MAAKQMNEAEMDNVTKSTAQLLSEQPKVKVKLWLNQEERKKLETAKESGKNVVWPSEMIAINGHTFILQKGIEVEVPESVKEILEQAGLI